MMARISVLAALVLSSACPPARTETGPSRPAAAPLDIQSYSETQPYTALAVLKGSLYAGTPAGLIRFDLATRQHVRLTREQGLPGNKVFAVSGHPESGLWVATDGGLSRFHDGAWTNIPLPALRGVTAMVAMKDAVWIGGAQGLALHRRGEWKRFLPGARISILRADLDGEGVWVGTEGEGLYHARGDRFVSYSGAQGQPLRRVSGLAFTKEGGLVALGRDDIEEQRLAFFDGQYWTALSVAPRGHLYWVERIGTEVLVAYNNQLVALERVDPQLEKRPDLLPRGGPTLTATPSPKAPSGTPVPRFAARPVERWLPTDPTVMFVHGDQVLIGTRTAGVAAVDGKKVTWYRTRDLLGGDRLRVACAGGGSCYLATGGRALRLGSGGFRPVSVDPDSTLRVQTFVEGSDGPLALSVAADGLTLVVSQLRDNQFTRLFESKLTVPEGRAELRFARTAPGGGLWVGLSYVDAEGSTHAWGVAVLAAGTPPLYHRSTLAASEDRAPGSLALPDDIRDVLFLGEDTWFSTSSGVCRVRGTKVDLFTENEGLESEIVYALARGPGGQLFAASHGGVGRFDGKHWRFDLGDLLRKPTRALQGRGEELWVGTAAGLVAWTPKGDPRVIDISRGLAGDLVLDLYLEADRRLWILTADGLSILTL